MSEQTPPVRGYGAADYGAADYVMDPVAEMLGGGRVVGYRVVLGHACGGALAGLLLSQFWYWQNLETARVRDGWFWARQPEITEATALTRSETETARRRLVGLNLVAEEHREDNALWFHIHKDVLYRRLVAYSQEKGVGRNARTKQTGMRGPSKPECEDQANRNVETQHSLHTENSPKTSPKRGDAPEPATPLTPPTGRSERRSDRAGLSPRTFPPVEPHPSQSVSHLLWRIETVLGVLLPRPAMGREAKAAGALLDAGYSEETILRHYLAQAERKPNGYTLHYLQTDIASLAARRGAYSAEIAGALHSLADEDGWEPERPDENHTGNTPKHERSREKKGHEND